MESNIALETIEQRRDRNIKITLFDAINKDGHGEYQSENFRNARNLRK